MAAKIAVYSALSAPMSAERFTEFMINSALAFKNRFCPICGAMPGAGPEACPVCDTSRGANERLIDEVFKRAIGEVSTEPKT